MADNERRRKVTGPFGQEVEVSTDSRHNYAAFGFEGLGDEPEPVKPGPVGTETKINVDQESHQPITAVTRPARRSE